MNILTKRAHDILKTVHASKGEKSEKLVLVIYRYPGEKYMVNSLPSASRIHCDGSLRAVAQLSEVFHEWDKLAQKEANGPQGRRPPCDA
jgi:hypothetical protein